MAYTLKLLFLAVLLVMTIEPMVTAARPLDPRPSSLVGRLKLDDESSTCWDSLMQLQSCTGELILFFLNGETYLGHGCCQAIHTIGNQCWPTMIDALGFTTEESDILQGYCDHEFDHFSTPSSPPSKGFVGPTGVVSTEIGV
ncbi:Prolamin_like domain-containing protein [Cephalotus follicularis]|uniref:Prolamin_like domain-containing protein n=1 Tax=Cephalotus follicularis TaxID=3775 RepID=A0A1Q3CBI8_CEPFO|nr:Prolamin_like domain-containing protein [Cephalotus follicularis]